MEFFTETLSGPTYFVVLVICIILILALIGVISELKYIPDNTSKNNTIDTKKVVVNNKQISGELNR